MLWFDIAYDVSYFGSTKKNLQKIYRLKFLQPTVKLLRSLSFDSKCEILIKL